MADETTTGSLNQQFIEDVFQRAQAVKRMSMAITPTASALNDLKSIADRHFPARSKVSLQTRMDEVSQLAPQEFETVAGASLTPFERYAVIETSARAGRTDAWLQNDAALELGQAMAAGVDGLFGTAIGTASSPLDVVGSDNAVLSLDDLYEAEAIHRENGEKGLLFAVLDTRQALAIKKELNASSTPTNVSEALKESLRNQYVIGKLGNIIVIESDNVHRKTNNTIIGTSPATYKSAVGGMYPAGTLVFDERDPIHPEHNYKPDYQSHQWIIIGDFAAGVAYPKQLVQLVGKVSNAVAV